VLFIDLKSAYDRVSRKILEDLLKDGVLKEWQIKLWKWLVTKQKVRLGKQVAECNNGVPQGSTASPGLWNVYCNPLIDTIANMQPEQITIRAYADDICITSTNFVRFKDCIKYVEEWCGTNNMIVNKRKSGIMICDWRTRGKGTTAEEIMGYPIVTEYKYLGGIINRNMKVKEHLDYIDRKISFLMSSLTSVRMMKDLRLSVNLFRTLIMPLIRLGLMNAVVTNKTDYNLF
jgi:hypothetical protein